MTPVLLCGIIILFIQKCRLVIQRVGEFYKVIVCLVMMSLKYMAQTHIFGNLQSYGKVLFDSCLDLRYNKIEGEIMKKLNQLFAALLIISFVFCFTACTNQEEKKPNGNSVTNQNMAPILETYMDFLEVEEKLIECSVNVLEQGNITGYFFDGVKLYLSFEPISEEHNVYFAKLMPRGENQFIKADAIYKYSDLPLFSEEMQSKDGYLIVFNNLFGKDLTEAILRVNDTDSLVFEIKGAKGEEITVDRICSSASYEGELLVKSVVYGKRTALLRCTLPENAQGTSVMIIYETDDGGVTKMPHNISCEILERNGQDILVQIPVDIKSLDKITFVSNNVYNVEFSAEIVL